ncbi:MAG: metalloregulator ArsR/SmtB family transcription factor [Chloroflexi bacterium]|nr:metalloregulator ArsR/SmtB family transcription factor [Chloroflexota bacterium]
MSEQVDKNLAERAKVFRALGHPMRLILLNLIREKPRHGQELAAILSLNPATVSHHLAALSNAGMVVSTKDQYYQIFSLVKENLAKTLDEMIYIPSAQMMDSVKEDAYKKKVLRTFFHNNILLAIPAQRKKQQIILEEIANAFEFNRKYSEKEVNHILVDFYEDVASLRRGLIDFGLMERSQGVYWRIKKPSDPLPESSLLTNKED